MIRLTLLLSILLLSTATANACNLEDLKQSINYKYISISGEVHKDISCSVIRTRLIKLINEEPESLQVQTQIQDLYYFENYMISIQIQYLWIDTDRVGQVQIFSF